LKVLTLRSLEEPKNFLARPSMKGPVQGGTPRAGVGGRRLGEKPLDLRARET
jgi:hypothetical protein